MADDNSTDRAKVTFSQAEGLEPMPTPLALGFLSQEARSLIWEVVHESFFRYGRYKPHGRYASIHGDWRTILYKKHVRVDFQPADEFSESFEEHNGTLKALIMSGAYNNIFDVLVFVMRHRDCPYEFEKGIHWALEESRTAYSIIPEGPTIIPIATPEEGVAITAAFTLTREEGFIGANTHLREAADALSKGDYSGSVRESIHAVESVACRLNEDASTTLGPALSTLEKSITLHPALKSGFSNIYGYTSDQDGIRHALLEGAADVDDVDATFMFGACASFVTYLINKARKSGIEVE